jgi:hypothetical protein
MPLLRIMPRIRDREGYRIERAEFGKIGLESGLSVSIMELMKKMSAWPHLVEKIALNRQDIGAHRVVKRGGGCGVISWGGQGIYSRTEESSLSQRIHRGKAERLRGGGVHD